MTRSRAGVGMVFAAAFLGGAITARAAPATVTLPGDRAFPESVTASADGTLYISNIDGGGVLRAKPGAAQAETWIKPGAFATRSTFGVLADDKAKMLWVCSNDASMLGLPGPSTAEGAYVKGFDLTTGEGKVSARLPGAKAICNDMALGTDGSLYVTNTLAPQILVLRPGATALAVWATDPQLGPPATGGAGMDGIAIGGDGNIYVNRFTPGDLFRVEAKDGVAGKVTALTTSKPLKLPDGLRPLGKTDFLMVEGGNGRLDHVTISGDTATIDVLKDGFIQPTGVTRAGSVAWVTDGQLTRLAYPKKGDAPALPFKVYAVPLATP